MENKNTIKIKDSEGKVKFIIQVGNRFDFFKFAIGLLIGVILDKEVCIVGSRIEK